MLRGPRTMALLPDRGEGDGGCREREIEVGAEEEARGFEVTVKAQR
jgi:hypothetical protein